MATHDSTNNLASGSEKFDTVMRKILSVSKDELKKKRKRVET